MIYTFYNCLKTKFKNFNNSILIIFSFVIFLSPTIRSLVVWHNQNNNDDFLDKGSYKVLIITDKDNLEKEFQIK